MTVYLYVTEVRDEEKNTDADEKGPRLYFFSKKPSELAPSGDLTKRITFVKWEDHLYAGDGYSFPLGRYDAPSYKVEITKRLETRGSGPARTNDTQYVIKGTFASLETAQAFEHELLYGHILPAMPLCGNRRTRSEDQYAAMCGDIVANTATMSALMKRLEALEVQIPGFQLRKTVYEALPGQMSGLEAQFGQLLNQVAARTIQ